MSILEKNLPFWRWLNAFIPPLVWAVIIFLFSAQHTIPGPEVVVFDFFIKKSAHMFVYAVLYGLLYRAAYLSTVTADAKPTAKVWIMPFLICLLYAASDEFHQSLVSGRTATPRDVGYDMLGALMSFLAIHRYL